MVRSPHCSPAQQQLVKLVSHESNQTCQHAQSPINKVSDDGTLSGRVGRLPGHNDIIPVSVMDLNVHGGSRGLRNWRETICKRIMTHYFM